MTASKRNPFDVPRRVAEYISSLSTVEEGEWYANSVAYEGGQYVIDSSYEEDLGYFDPPWGNDWVPDVRKYYRRDVVVYMGRRVPVKVVASIEWW